MEAALWLNANLGVFVSDDEHPRRYVFLRRVLYGDWSGIT